MDAGILDKRIKIHKDVGTSQSARGQHVEQWVLFLDCWASVEQIESNESEYGSKNTSFTSYSIIIRYTPDLIPNTKMAIEYDGLKLNIGSVLTASKESVLIRAINKDGEAWQA